MRKRFDHTNMYRARINISRRIIADTEAIIGWLAIKLINPLVDPPPEIVKAIIAKVGTQEKTIIKGSQRARIRNRVIVQGKKNRRNKSINDLSTIV